QERTGLHMADAVSRISSGRHIGIFAMQQGPGAENAFGGVAQAYGDSVPIVVLPAGYPRRLTNIPPNFNSALNYRHTTKSAGQGVHYARAWGALRELAEWLGAPVTTSLEGKSAFPETHPLSLGSGGRSIPKPVHHFLQRCDVIFGIGCSFAATHYGVAMPPGKVMIHATLDPADVNKDVPADHVLLGDAGLTLEALVEAVKDRVGEPRRD